MRFEDTDGRDEPGHDEASALVELGRGVGERVHDVGDDVVDQPHIVALGHDADHRLGAGGPDDEAADLPSRDLPLSIALRTARLSSG